MQCLGVFDDAFLYGFVWLGLFFLLQGDMYASSLHPVVSFYYSKKLLYIMFGGDNVSIRLVLFLGGVLLDYGFLKV